jgi:RNA 3'-terminal phosphate cyclase
MFAAAANPKVAKATGVPQKVAKKMVKEGQSSLKKLHQGEEMKKEVYEKARPKALGKPKALSPNQKAAAKRFAKSTGTKYPSLLANMRGAQAKK